MKVQWFGRGITVFLLTLTAACVGSQKSSNPLSPSVAGPIAGVGITPPTVMGPGVDAEIDTTTQPITFRIGNASTTGVRPLSLAVEIAVDPGFANKVFTRSGIPQDGSGATNLTLPTALPSERKYYWHARAEDGANTGPFSATSAFTVYTPVIFGTPVLIAPIGDITTGTQQPSFVIANANRTGPAGVVFYQIEISRTSNFDQIVAAYQYPESPTRTELTVPVSLATGQYYWRVRAFTSGFTGPFSGGQSFRTPSVGGGGGGGPSNPGQPCGPPYPTTPIGILECRRSQYPTNWSDSDQVAFLRGSAKDFNSAGISGGPFGILLKPSGNNCDGYSCDIICAGNGSSQRQWDVLIDEKYVTFREVIDPRVRECEIQ
jgi:hypothetical protein